MSGHSGAPNADLQIPASAASAQDHISETSASTIRISRRTSLKEAPSGIDNDQEVDLEDVVRRVCRVVFHLFILVPAYSTLSSVMTTAGLLSSVATRRNLWGLRRVLSLE